MSERKSKASLKPAGTTMAFPESTHPLARCLPRDDRVVVRRDGVKTETPGGIILPESMTGASKTQLGTVHSVGPGALKPDGTRIPLGLAPGDRVIIAPYAALEINDPSAGTSMEEFVILKSEDILATLPRASKT